MHNLGEEFNLFVAAMAIAISLRFLQKRFPKNDPLYLERLIISACAGLFLLAAINKLLVNPSLAPLSIPYAAATFAVSIFHAGYGTVKVLSPRNQVIFSLIAPALVALVSGMWFGLIGILVVVPTALIFPQAKPSNNA